MIVKTRRKQNSETGEWYLFHEVSEIPQLLPGASAATCLAAASARGPVVEYAASEDSPKDDVYRNEVFVRMHQVRKWHVFEDHELHVVRCSVLV